MQYFKDKTEVSMITILVIVTTKGEIVIRTRIQLDKVIHLLV